MSTDTLLLHKNKINSCDSTIKPEKPKTVIINHRRKKDSWLRTRLAVQLFFAGLCVWIGWEFYEFSEALRSGASVVLSDRPPGIEGFLPISSLMELRLWIKAGIAPHIHPAGVVLLSFAIGTAFLIRRGFCSWLCPVGLVSELFTRFGIKAGLSVRPVKWIDIPLRALKYILLVFFLYAIFGMSTEALHGFITGDYNRASDIKMLDFFTSPSRMTLSVLGILALLTLVIKNFWCRYLCPYGAILGIISRFSPAAIRRNAATCINCGKCDAACPAYLAVATSTSVLSAECLACHQCTAACPVRDCLTLSTPKKRLTLTPFLYAAVFTGLFLTGVLLAKSAGYWQGSTNIEEYRRLSKITEILDHPKSLDGYK